MRNTPELRIDQQRNTLHLDLRHGLDVAMSVDVTSLAAFFRAMSAFQFLDEKPDGVPWEQYLKEIASSYGGAGNGGATL